MCVCVCVNIIHTHTHTHTHTHSRSGTRQESARRAFRTRHGPDEEPRGPQRKVFQQAVLPQICDLKYRRSWKGFCRCVAQESVCGTSGAGGAISSPVGSNHTAPQPAETQSGYLCHVTRSTHLVTRFHVTMNVNLEPRHVSELVSARGRHKFVVQHKYVVHVVHVSARGRQMYT